jgi:peptidyl-prolyl cis-trans isomerase B (cyclophilin B)
MVRAMRRSAFVLALLALAAVACHRDEPVSPAAAQPAVAEPPLDRLPTAVLRVRGFGEIRVALRPDVAPKTVENMTKLAASHFYDGTTFHRVVPGFMIQGGDPNSKDRDPRNDGFGGPGWRIPDEPSGLHHARGAISMAKAGPNSAGSQFFIVVADAPQLDDRFTAFGRVVAGMDVVDRIVAVPRDEYERYGPRDRPLEDVVIESLVVEPPKEATP